MLHWTYLVSWHFRALSFSAPLNTCRCQCAVAVPRWCRSWSVLIAWLATVMSVNWIITVRSASHRRAFCWMLLPVKTYRCADVVCYLLLCLILVWSCPILLVLFLLVVVSLYSHQFCRNYFENFVGNFFNCLMFWHFLRDSCIYFVTEI